MKRYGKNLGRSTTLVRYRRGLYPLQTRRLYHRLPDDTAGDLYTVGNRLRDLTGELYAGNARAVSRLHYTHPGLVFERCLSPGPATGENLARRGKRSIFRGEALPEPRGLPVHYPQRKEVGREQRQIGTDLFGRSPQGRLRQAGSDRIPGGLRSIRPYIGEQQIGDAGKIERIRVEERPG